MNVDEDEMSVAGGGLFFSPVYLRHVIGRLLIRRWWKTIRGSGRDVQSPSPDTGVVFDVIRVLGVLDGQTIY